jgi:hypothetical protein
MTSTLRDELRAGAAPVPPFALLLPRGWVSREPTGEFFAELLSQVSAVLRSQHRPDLDAQFRRMLGEASSELLRRDPVRMIYQSGVDPDEMFPLSIVIVRLTDPDGGPLDRRVRELVRRHDAVALDPEAAILRWHSDGRLQVQGGVATVRSFNYLVAIPGTERRQALLISAVLPIAAGEVLNEETIAGAQSFVDAIVSTFHWVTE